MPTENNGRDEFKAPVNSRYREMNAGSVLGWIDKSLFAAGIGILIALGSWNLLTSIENSKDIVKVNTQVEGVKRGYRGNKSRC